MPSAARVLAVLLLMSAVAPAHATDWALATSARCTGPDGSSFTTEIVSLPDGTVRFLQERSDGTAAFVVRADGTAFQRDEDSGVFEPAADAVADFVRGHDVHRLYLQAAGDGPGPASLEVENPPALGGDTVTIEYADPKTALGVALPRAVTFVHQGEPWAYAFDEVLPFRVAPNRNLPDEPTLLFARLGDLGALARLHEKVLRAHRQSDVAMLVEDQAERGIQSGRGRLVTDTRAGTRERLGGYLQATEFERYEDVVAPVVAVAGDGSMGWVACEVEAEGTQESAAGEVTPVAFGFSWVELYAREDGRWMRVGNASSGRE